jgi:HAD superfamily hydrolase (TIGR01662 family)
MKHFLGLIGKALWSILMSFNMWGEESPTQHPINEDFELTHEQKMDKYHKPLVAFDRDGVLFESNGIPIRSREEATPIEGAFAAIGIIRRKGYKIAMVCDQPAIASGELTNEQVEDINGYVIDLLGDANCPSIDCMLYNTSNEKYDLYAKPNKGMFDRLRDEFRVPIKGGFYIGDQVIDAKFALKSKLKPIIVKTGMFDEKRWNSFSNEKYRKATKIYDTLMEFAHTLP